MNIPKAFSIVLVLGLAGAGLYLYSVRRVSAPPPPPAPVVIPSGEATSSDVPNPAAGSTVLTTTEWKTYTNRSGTISFKYPGTPDGATPSEKTTGTGTQVSVQIPGLNFDFFIQPIRTGTPKYYGDSAFAEKYTAGAIAWDVSKSTGICDRNNNCGLPFVAFQSSRNNTQYAFVFSGDTAVTELEQTIVSTFMFTDSVSATPYPDTRSAIAAFLANKYSRPVSEVNVTVTKEVPGFASGSVSFGRGGPGEGGMWLAVLGNGWDVVWDGNGSVDCDKMRREYGFPDTILKPDFCN